MRHFGLNEYSERFTAIFLMRNCGLIPDASWLVLKVIANQRLFSEENYPEFCGVTLDPVWLN